eukprot:scaffold26660_cov157-Isochrysis_galbana.AAC.3
MVGVGVGRRVRAGGRPTPGGGPKGRWPSRHWAGALKADSELCARKRARRLDGLADPIEPWRGALRRVLLAAAAAAARLERRGDPLVGGQPVDRLWDTREARQLLAAH